MGYFNEFMDNDDIGTVSPGDRIIFGGMYSGDIPGTIINVNKDGHVDIKLDDGRHLRHVTYIAFRKKEVVQ